MMVRGMERPHVFIRSSVEGHLVPSTFQLFQLFNAALFSLRIKLSLAEQRGLVPRKPTKLHLLNE